MCQSAIEKNSVKSHLKKQHKDAHSNVNIAELTEVIESLKVVSTLLTITGPCSPLKGLPILNGFVCHCSHVFGTLNSLQTHHRKCHKDSDQEWHECKVQRLHGKGCGNCTYWEVKVESIQRSKDVHQNLVNELMKEIEQELTVVVAPPDACMIGPLLYKTGWDEYVA